MKATPDSHVELAHEKVFESGKGWTAPVLVDGLLYLRDSKNSKGEPPADSRLGSPHASPPRTEDHVLRAASAPLELLAPDIQERILSGELLLSARALRPIAQIPDWAEQRREVGRITSQ